MDQAEQLRNVIKQKNQNKYWQCRVITITSGKGGVGKSNMAVNLAIMFRKMGQRVIILDADFGLANVEVMFGTVPKYNLSDLIFGGKSIREIITTRTYGYRFYLGWIRHCRTQQSDKRTDLLSGAQPVAFKTYVMF